MINPEFVSQYWEVENTGWSGGISWFTCEINKYEPRHFKLEEMAMEYVSRKKLEFNDENMLWRIISVTVTGYEDGNSIVKKWKQV